MPDKSFSYTWCGICSVVALWPVFHGGAVRWFPAVLALTLALVALLRPGLVAPLNRLMTRFSEGMHIGVSLVALFLIYYVVLTPGGLLLRACGRRRVPTGSDPAVVTYWQVRDKRGTDFTRPY